MDICCYPFLEPYKQKINKKKKKKDINIEKMLEENQKIYQ